MNKNIEKKLLKIIYQRDEIQNIINGIEKAKKYSDENKIVPDDSIENIILKKYLELCSIKKVSDYINELGYKIKSKYKNGGTSERKYTPNDISNVIISENLEIDKELQEYALMIYKLNYNSIQNIFV